MSQLSNFSDEDIIELLSSGAESELKRRGYQYGWHKKEEFVGAIYILVNPAFPDLVKIGYANDVPKRLKTLNRNSGLPGPFHCYAIYKVKKRLEDLKLHHLIDSLDSSLRHSQNREFYEMDYHKAYEILSAIAQINGDEEKLVINPFADNYFVQQEESQTESVQGNNTAKKEKLRFSAIGIPVGSTLVFIRDNSITCITKDDENKVEYQGQTYSLSGLAKKLMNANSIQGGKYFMYQGEILTDIRERLQV